MSHVPPSPVGFAPSDPTDGREPLDWKSKYDDRDAQKAIRMEAFYLGFLLAICPLLLVVFWLDYPQKWFAIPDTKYPAVWRYSVAWLGGMLGGTLFDIKWLYHSVAHRVWHLDRRLWRVFTPHISGGLAFAVTALVTSGIVRLFDGSALQSGSVIVSMAFLVGYFSDSAIAKLSEIAETLFGASRSKAPLPKPPDSLPKSGA